MVTVEFMGIFRDMTGTGEIQLDVSGIINVLDLVEELGKRFPLIHQYLKTFWCDTYKVSLYSSIAIVKDGQICKISDPVEDNDRIIIILPCTGG